MHHFSPALAELHRADLHADAAIVRRGRGRRGLRRWAGRRTPTALASEPAAGPGDLTDARVCEPVAAG